MRRKFTERERQRYLAELKASGEKPWSFAHRVGITPANLYRWMRLERRRTAPQFALLVPKRTPAIGSRVSVQIGDATVQVEPGFDAALLRAVVAALSDKVSS
jgi:transposase-like protein